MDKRISKLRNQIDTIDGKLVSLLEERAEVVRKIRELKEELRLPLHDQQREDQIVERLARSATGILGKEQLEKIYRALFASERKARKC